VKDVIEAEDPVSERKDDLWSRIKALAEKQDISYLDAAEKCVREYWKDKGLSKKA